MPIQRYNVRSFITSLQNDAKLKVGEKTTVHGIAFDGGSGIRAVSFSNDGGKTWRETELGRDLGKYSFREWTSTFTPKEVGRHVLQVRAINHSGQSQPAEALWNPAGYMRNVIESVTINAT